jgi:hypothetical protein
MQPKTKKKVLIEIGVLGLLSLFMYRPMTVLCWKLLDMYRMPYDTIYVIVTCFAIVSAWLTLHATNRYVKVAFAYIGIFICVCLLSIIVIIRFMPV